MEDYLMARRKVGGDVLQVRFFDGTLERIDAVHGNRSEFIRDAVEAALSAGGGVRDYVAVAGPARNELLADLPMKPAPAEPEPPAAPEKNSIASPSDKRAAARAWGATLRETDMKSILEVARSGRYSSRDIECQLGLPGLRYKKAEDALLRSGLIRFEGGLVHAN
jgi:hypothetical protein